MNRLEEQGQFEKAAAGLNDARRRAGLDIADKQLLDFELDRLERIKKDFPFTKEALFTELKRSVRNLTAAEYEQWLGEGRFDSREIDGQRYFMAASVSNLFFRHSELEDRRIPRKDTTGLQQAVLQAALAIQQAARTQQTPYVLPKRFQATMTLIAEPDAAPDGATIRAWLPIPREYPFQRDFEVLSASGRAVHLDALQSPIRSLYMEQLARQGKSTRFDLKYNYTFSGVWFDLDPAKVQPCDPNDSALAPFTREGPHVQFTPEMRALSQQIAGMESNPYRKAKKFHDWIAENIKYSFSIEYSTIRNLGDYCRVKGYGDCGQEGLLFITLCRLNGIPARWQSGWNLFPGAQSIHDWTEIYLAPYGWIPVDPYMGIFAHRYSPALRPEQRRTIRDFYFGGLDQYRMAANSDHCQTLVPPKRFMRSDDVDFQRGELEWGEHNIYFDRYSYSLALKELSPARDSAARSPGGSRPAEMSPLLRH